MIYTTFYDSPIGKIAMAGNEEGLKGLWFEKQKYFMSGVNDKTEEKGDISIFKDAKIWLNKYFDGERDIKISGLRLSPDGNSFRKAVWKILCTIPYGEVISYKEISKIYAAQAGIERMSAQAIGNAVGHNPISIIIPCHRVVGGNGSLTGYAGGIDKKIFLLKHEGADMSGLFVPKKIK